MSRSRAAGSLLVVGSLALLLVVAMTGLSQATLPTGGTVGELLGQGSIAHSSEIHSTAGTDVVTVRNTFPPGADSGWHSHPGVAVVIVASGQITIWREDVTGGPCTHHTYTAGQTFLERPTKLQNGVNDGTTDAVAIVTFFQVPHGGSARIDRPAPTNCSS